MSSEPPLIGAFREQARAVLAGGDPGALRGLWAAWADQAGICRDDLEDVLKEEGGVPPG